MDKKQIKKNINNIYPELIILDIISSKYALVKNEYGICKIQIYGLLAGSKPTISTALNKTEYFKNKLKEVQPDICIISEYKGALNKVNVKTKYGICNCVANNLLNGQIPGIRSAIDKTEYFINMSNDLHNNKYDYSLVKYINHSIKVDIICKTHGIFKQTPSGHTINKGCKKCGDVSKMGGWYKNTANHKKKSNVYIIRFTNSKHTFLKIGISINIKKRIQKLTNDTNNNYKITLIKSISNNVYYCYQFEKKFKHKIKHQNRKYLPNIYFCGKNECFDFEKITKLNK